MTGIKPSHMNEDEEFVKKLREIRNGRPVSLKEIKKEAEKSNATDEEIAAWPLTVLIIEKEKLGKEGTPPLQ